MIKAIHDLNVTERVSSKWDQVKPKTKKGVMLTIE